jgi:hypothetical protein
MAHNTKSTSKQRRKPVVKEAIIHARVPVEVRDVIFSAAAADDRTASSLISRVLTAWAREQGLLGNKPKR